MRKLSDSGLRVNSIAPLKALSFFSHGQKAFGVADADIEIAQFRIIIDKFFDFFFVGVPILNDYATIEADAQLDWRLAGDIFVEHEPAKMFL